MKIAYIMRYWPVYGGGETITVSLANELVCRGHEVHALYTYHNTSEPMPYDLDSRIRQMQLHTIERYDLKDVNLLHDYLLQNQIDVMINQWGSTTLCDEARRGTKTKLVTCWHLDVVQKQSPSSTKQKILRFLLGDKYFQRYRQKKQLENHFNNFNRSDKYVFLSRSFEENYRVLSKIKNFENKLESVPNPLTYDLNYNRADMARKKKQVLFVGRILESHKRVSYALKIWKQIEDDVDYSDWNFKIVGDGPDMGLIKKLSADLDLKRASFEGFRDPRPYYNESSIFVMTSAFEGFGMTLVEAQQYGVVPMAMDSYLSLHDIVENGINGIIIENDNIEEYVSKLKKLMSNETERRSMAYAGLDSCKRFSVKAIVDHWEKLFNQLME